MELKLTQITRSTFKEEGCLCSWKCCDNWKFSNRLTDWLLWSEENNFPPCFLSDWKPWRDSSDSSELTEHGDQRAVPGQARQTPPSQGWTMAPSLITTISRIISHYKPFLTFCLCIVSIWWEVRGERCEVRGVYPWFKGIVRWGMLERLSREPASHSGLHLL